MASKKGKIEQAMHAKSGQALIIILLVMAVSLTLGVSVATRAISTVRQLSFSVQSVEALAYAEAGVEEALQQRCSTTGGCTNGTYNVNLTGSTNATYTISDLSGQIVSFPPLERDSTLEIRLSGYGGNAVNVYFVNRASSSEMTSNPAIEFSVISSSGSNYSLTKLAFDTISRGNGLPVFGQGTYSIGGKSYRYLRTVGSLPATKVALRIRILYATAPLSIAVQGAVNVNLPVQGDTITSTGTSGTVKRRVEVIRSLPALSTLFDHAVFSGSTTQSLSR